MLNNTAISDDERNETISCFNKLANIGHKLERLNRARHKFVLRPLVHRPFAHKTYDRRHYDIEKVLSHWQVRKLHSYLAKTGDSESIIKAFRHHFGQFPMTTQSHLIDEFFHYSPSLRRSGHQRRETQRQTSKSKRSSTSNNLDRHQKSLSVITEIEHEHKMLLEKANAYLQRLDGRTRRQKTEQVIALCARLADRIFGDEKTLGFRGKHQVGATDIDIERRLGEAISKLEKKYKQANDQGFKELRSVHEESMSIEQLTKKYTELIDALSSEQQRVNAERVGLFCKKIYRLTKFDSTYLTTWLTAEEDKEGCLGLLEPIVDVVFVVDLCFIFHTLSRLQKRELQYMIQDPDINDQAVYDRLLEFYKSTEGEKRNDAKEIIESGCKWFISHMLGEDIADRIEDQRQSGNFSAQMLSATLAKHVSEIENEKQRIKTQKTLRICERIYLGYAGDCFCNGHSSICDSLTHFCVGCEDNTDGIECENCAAGYVGSGLLGAE
uniref:Laminin EGF-like domain-containing protein n=1 Tax=Parascaris equorum TaxID=6256 RepID=A0A914RZG9_PAREQ